MSKEEKKKLVPAFRFPAFKDKNDWTTKRLCDIGDILQGYGFPEIYQGKKSGEFPFFKVSDISIAIHNDNHHIKVAANYIDSKEVKYLRAKPIPKGTTIFAKIGEAIRLNRRALTLTDSLMDNNVAGVKAIEGKGTDNFIFYTLTKIDLIDYSGGAVPSINKTTLENIPVFVPTDLEEQQKIADCLSSLDELMAAQNSKLEALKAHKKGLMQALFPAEGETVPRLRYPEFRESGDWEEKTLEKVAEVGRGKSKHRPRDASFLYGGAYPFIQTGDIRKSGLYLTEFTQTYSEEGLKQSKLWNENTLCITIAANIAETAILRIKACFPDSVIGIIPKVGLSEVLFLKYLFDNFKIQIQKQSQGMAQDNLNQEKLTSIKFIFPTLAEQQKIADCLSCLDALITAQTEKLEGLKLHKKGLMQGLFPATGNTIETT